MYQRILYSLLVSLFLTSVVQAQQYNIGIRAGLNQSKFIGPSEANATEIFSLSGGFHFGINFQWNFTESIGLRSEIVYSQVGSKYKFRSDDAYYLYRPVLTSGTYPQVRIVGLDSAPRDEWQMLRDKTAIDITFSNSYLQLPQTVHLRIGKKFEVYAGGYLGIMLSPLGFGKMKFGEGNPFDNPHIFEQGFDFNYSSDREGRYVPGINAAILLIVNEKNVDLPRTIGAYYFIEKEEDIEKRYNTFDYGLISGLSYYFNRGLYGSFRVEYGLSDITRTLGDVSFQELKPGNVAVYNDDFDRNLNFSLSIGFKF